MRERSCARRVTVATLVLLAVIAGSFVPMARGSAYEYRARKLLTSMGINAGAYATARGKYFGVQDVGGNFNLHAAVWNHATQPASDPGAGWIHDALGNSYAGNLRVGFDMHAMLWNASGSALDLHPAGFGDSSIRGLAPGVQVGVAYTPVAGRAMLWRGSAASAASLHPAGYGHSEALAAAGNQQVGVVATNPIESEFRAALWNSSAGSFVNLHPSGRGYSSSRALGVSRGWQVGLGVWGKHYFDQTHALLWKGSAASVLNLNPSGFTSSRATRIVGDWVIGDGTDGAGRHHTLIWDLSTTPYTVYDIQSASDAIDATYARPWNLSSSGEIVGVDIKYLGTPGHAAYSGIVWSPQNRIIGDANLDGNVTFADFQLLQRNFGSNDSYWKLGDFNDDRETTFADFLLLRANFGKSATGQSLALPHSDQTAIEAFHAAHVPEPAGAAVLMLALTTLARRRLARRPPLP